MGRWNHGGGFSLDASVRIEGADLTGRERLLRYCARPPFALDHLHQHDAERLVYNLPKPRPDEPNALVLTPVLEHPGEPTRRPRFAPARGPPLWQAVTAAPPAENDPRSDAAAQALPQIEFDQRLAW